MFVFIGVQGGDHEGALRAFDLMHEKGFTSAITPSTYNKLIHSGSKCASLDAAFQVWICHLPLCPPPMSVSDLTLT